jgi:hypothetical protein
MNEIKMNHQQENLPEFKQYIHKLHSLCEKYFIVFDKNQCGNYSVNTANALALMDHAPLASNDSFSCGDLKEKTALGIFYCFIIIALWIMIMLSVILYQLRTLIEAKKLFRRNGQSPIGSDNEGEETHTKLFSRDFPLRPITIRHKEISGNADSK